MSEKAGTDPGFDDKGRPVEPMRFESSGGRTVVLIPVETFPDHINNLYFVGPPPEKPEVGWLLFDVGTSLPTAREWRNRNLALAEERWGLGLGFEQVAHVVLSHAHVDHFGAVHELADGDAVIYIHELDARVLSNFSERVVIAAHSFDVFLRNAGVSNRLREKMTRLYAGRKDTFPSFEVDVRLRHGDDVAGCRVHHVPGHCPGMVALQVDDILLTADHVLSRITPNQAPQSITPFTGLETYLRSLEKAWDISGISLGLGGHEAPIQDVQQRVLETVRHHEQRLNRCLELCATEGAQEHGMTVAEVSTELFGKQSGWGIYLALTEAGAHMEYLHQLGHLALANLDDISTDEVPVFRYRTRHPGASLDLVAIARARRKKERER